MSEETPVPLSELEALDPEVLDGDSMFVRFEAERAGERVATGWLEVERLPEWARRIANGASVRLHNL